MKASGSGYKKVDVTVSWGTDGGLKIRLDNWYEKWYNKIMTKEIKKRKQGRPKKKSLSEKALKKERKALLKTNRCPRCKSKRVGLRLNGSKYCARCGQRWHGEEEIPSFDRRTWE